MAESFVNVTEGSGKKLHTSNRTIGANDVHDEIVLPGIAYLACYVVTFSPTSIATAASHVLQIMAGGTLNVYVVAFEAFQHAAATTAAPAELRLTRLTTAGTGGTAITPRRLDGGDAASGATAMTLPTVKGTENEVMYLRSAYLTQTPGAAGTNFEPIMDWAVRAGGLAKPIRIPAGTANGLAFTNVTAIAGATVSGTATIIEATF